MDTKTIDEKLRTRADRRLATEVEHAFAPVERLLQNKITKVRLGLYELNPPDSKTNPGQYVPVYVYDVLSLLKSEAIRIEAPDYRQEEINSFLEDVESLKERLGQLEAEY